MMGIRPCDVYIYNDFKSCLKMVGLVQLYAQKSFLLLEENFPVYS
jgi:hypothetical protein